MNERRMKYASECIQNIDDEVRGEGRQGRVSLSACGTSARGNTMGRAVLNDGEIHLATWVDGVALLS